MILIDESVPRKNEKGISKIESEHERNENLDL